MTLPLAMYPTTVSVNDDHRRQSTKTTIAAAAINCRHQSPPKLLTANNVHHHRRHRPKTLLPPPHHHNGAAKTPSPPPPSITNHHCHHLTAVGSIPPPPPMTMTAILAIIALAIVLPQRRMKQWGEGPAVAHAIHRRIGCCCGCRLCCHANICGQEEVGHHNPIAPVPVDSYHRPCSTLTPPHTSQFPQDLSMSSTLSSI